MKATPADTGHTILLAEVLDLKAATPLAAQLLAARGTEMLLDASRVQRLGAQCVQVLVSAFKTWSADEVSIEIIEPSSDFIEGLELLGLSHETFMQPQLA